MKSSLIGVLILLPSLCAGQGDSLDHCLSFIGLPGADSSPWTASVTLVVSADRDASKVEFDRQGREHASYLVFTVLRTLRFRKDCIGRQLSFSVAWEASKDGSYGVALRRGALILTGSLIPRRRGMAWGPLTIETEDLETLRRSVSMREFLRRKGADPDY